MNKQDLDALANLYEEVYYPHQELNEKQAYASLSGTAPPGVVQAPARQDALRQASQINAARKSQSGTIQTASGLFGSGNAGLGGRTDRFKRDSSGNLIIQPNPSFPYKPTGANAGLDKTIKYGGEYYNRLTKDNKVSYVRAGSGGSGNPGSGGSSNPPTAPKPPSSTLASTSSNPVTRTAVERPSTVLAKQGGVEGRLDKATGKFTAGAFSAAEKSRYASVAAKNAASSAQSTSAKPAVGKLGSTSFERRTPTSAELKAAQGARERGANPEQALQAAKMASAGAAAAAKPMTTTPNAASAASLPALTKSASTPPPASTENLGQKAFKSPTSGASEFKSPTPDINKIASATQQKKPPTPGTGATKPMTQSNSYEWPSGRTIKDLANAYSSIYEAKKKVDQDEDGDNDFADVRIARMIASGVPKEKAIAMTKNKSYNEDIEYIEERDEGKPGLMFKKIAASAAKRYGSKEAGNRVAGAIRKKVLANEATAMAKRGHDETAIRNKIAKSTGGGEAADRATALENRPTYGNSAKQKARQNLARAQRGDFRSTTSSNPGLHGYAYKSDDPDVEAKQAARGAQRGVLTPREKKQLNREAYEAYEFVASYLLENNFASTVEDANVIINNMSEGWFNQIMEG
jgi:hypothetical protein